MRRSDVRRLLAEYVRERLREECTERGGQAKVAKSTSFTTAHVANVIHGIRGVGDDFLHAIAAHWGMTVPELEVAAAKWVETSPVAIRGREYPNLAEAIEISRRGGISEAAIQSLLADPLPPQDLSTLEWIQLLLDRDRLLRLNPAVRR